MRTNINKLLAKINEIRMLYITTNNTLVDSVDEVFDSFQQSYIAFDMDISIEALNSVQSSIAKIKKASVDSITFGLYNCFELLEKNGNKTDLYTPKRFSKNITNILEEAFKCNQYPSDFEKSTLSELCNLSVKQITNWFTNKRNRFKNLNKKYFSCTL